MTSIDVLLDLFDRQINWFQRDLADIDPDLWVWRPQPEANSIFLTMWHLARIMDWLYNRALHGLPATAEFWHTKGWAEKSGYDPTGLGWERMGILSGYTQEEVVDIPHMTAAEILTYLDQSYGPLKRYLRTLPEGGLETLAPGMDGGRTVYFWCQLSLVDLMQHWGEILAIKAMWERRKRTQISS